MSSRGNNNSRSRGNRGGRGRGRGGAKSAADTPKVEDKETVEELPPFKGEEEESNTTDGDLCFICANPVIFYSVGPCNHRTCHVCALRLRALYKNNKCAYCKEEQLTLIFTMSSSTLFSDYKPEEIPYKDAKLNISFETQEMLDETLILLRFNCPDASCDYVGRGWGDLNLHVRSVHGRVLCDLCISHKKVFAHEHTLYTPQALLIHLPEGGKRRGPKKSSAPPAEANDGDQPHPACLFCHRCFFGPDELYKHMREVHEDCFICKRDQGTSEYFLDYPRLEEHFQTAHFPCPHPTCQANKFVVFGSQLDLKAHVVADHAGDMSAAGIKDARRIEVTFEDVNRRGRGRGRGAGAGGGRGGRERDREPPPHAGPSHGGGGGRRREGFGSQLTSGANDDDAAGSLGQPIRISTPVNLPGGTAGDADPAVLARHNAFLSLLASNSSHPQSAVTSVKSAIRSWKMGESSAKDLISLIYAVLDNNLEKTASVINAFVSLLDTSSSSSSTTDEEEKENEERKREVLREWRGFEVEKKREFPSLVPTAVLPSSSAAANAQGTQGAAAHHYANVTGGRAVINAKTHTATRGGKGNKGRVWDRVAEVAAASAGAGPSGSGHGAGGSGSNTPRPAISRVSTAEKFPPLQSSSAAIVPNAGRGSTPWASATSSSSAAPSSSKVTTVASIPRPASSSQSTGSPSQKPPKLASQELFPSLAPSPAAVQREKVKVGGNSSLRNILGSGGSTAPPPNMWGTASSGGSGGSGSANGTAGQGQEQVEGGSGVGKGGGKKGKAKQTLFTLGSFPS